MKTALNHSETSQLLIQSLQALFQGVSYSTLGHIVGCCVVAVVSRTFAPFGVWFSQPQSSQTTRTSHTLAYAVIKLPTEQEMLGVYRMKL